MRILLLLALLFAAVPAQARLSREEQAISANVDREADRTIALLERMREVFEHRFLSDDVPLVVGGYVGVERVASYRHVTDAHLLAVARRHGASLVTLDRGIAALGGGEDVIVVAQP